MNCAGTNSSNFTMILSFYRSKSHSFQDPKKTGFPWFLFSATRNPGFKILPRIGNTACSRVKFASNKTVDFSLSRPGWKWLAGSGDEKLL